MGLKVGREPDGRVAVVVTVGSQQQAVSITSVEARLLAIKLLLAAEHFAEPPVVGDQATAGH